MGRNWAITIGINQYQNLQPLNYAKRDAELLRDYFKDEVSFEQVYYFSDDSPPIEQDYGPTFPSHPTYGTLRRFLRVRFEEPFLTAGDNFWFFFAGHGVRHEDRDYLMPIDGDLGDVEATGIPFYFITERLRRCGADNIVLLLDACRREGSRAGQGIGTEIQQGVIALFSCSPNESSYELESLQQGAFTYALLQGLRNGNCATAGRLYQYLRNEVPKLNLRDNKPPQNPYSVVEPLTKYNLILLPEQALREDVTTLKLDAFSAESARNLELAKQLWTRVLLVSPADPDAINGISRISQSGSEPPLPTPQPSSRSSNSLTRRRFIITSITGRVGVVGVFFVGVIWLYKTIFQPCPPGSEPNPTIQARLEPVGSLAGNKFEDRLPDNSEEIAKICIHGGFCIDAVQLTYRNRLNDKQCVGPKHGGEGGKLADQEISLQKGEFITGISGEVGSNNVKSLIIRTNLKPHGYNKAGDYKTNEPSSNNHCGDAIKPYDFKAPLGHEIIGFFGTYGHLVNSIGVLLRKRQT